MQDRIYLLDLAELRDGRDSEFLFRKAQELVDEQRLQKVMRIHSSAVRAASLGAGLLIQKAVAEREFPAAFFQRFSVGELLGELAQVVGENGPRQLRYRYGEQGKPYLSEIPLQFSISHSGAYVLCAASEREIGADIQQMRLLKNFRVAERFFSEREMHNIRQSGNDAQEEFYRLWVHKEAYGKLTGEGIAAVAGRNLEELDRELLWAECPRIEGYQLAVCRYRTEYDGGLDDK